MEISRVFKILNLEPDCNGKTHAAILVYAPFPYRLPVKIYCDAPDTGMINDL